MNKLQKIKQRLDKAREVILLTAYSSPLSEPYPSPRSAAHSTSLSIYSAVRSATWSSKPALNSETRITYSTLERNKQVKMIKKILNE